MDKIFIKNYIVIAKHGYYKEEHYKSQRFVVSVIVKIDKSNAGESDDLRDTFNYEYIRNAISEVVKSDSKKLLEFLAENIANKILSYEQVKEVEVEIYKPDIWGDCEPGVNILRVR